MERYISIVAYGNPDANSGYDPIVWFNNPNIEVKKDEYSGFAANSYYYVVKTESNKAVYTIVKNHVRSMGATRDGVSLKIAISVPKGFAFADGKTPYDVLNTLKDVFLKRCMKMVDATSELYEYNTNRIDKTVLDDVAKQFALVERRTVWHPMTGTAIGYCLMPQRAMKEFFNDIQYTDFEGFKEIVIAENVVNTSYVPVNINVPRKIAYTICFNDKKVRQVTDLHLPLSFQTEQNSQFYVNKKITFTVSDVLEGKTPSDCVIWEPEEERINVRLTATPKTTQYYLKIMPAEAQAQASQFQLSIQDRRIPLGEGLTFSLSGEANALINKLRLTDPSGNWKMQGSMSFTSDPANKAQKVNITLIKAEPARDNGNGIILGGTKNEWQDITNQNVTEKRDGTDSSAAKRRKKKRLMLIVAASAVVMFGVGFLCASLFSKSNESKGDCQTTAKAAETPNGTGKGNTVQDDAKKNGSILGTPEAKKYSAEEIIKYVNESQELLEKSGESLRFDQVDSISRICYKNPEIKQYLDTTKNEKHRNYLLQLENYNKVITLVREGCFECLKDYLNETPAKEFHIFHKHLVCLHNACLKDSRGRIYRGKQLEKIREYFDLYHKEFQTFADLMAVPKEAQKIQKREIKVEITEEKPDDETMQEEIIEAI